ncbi:MAG: DegT/DnrJ/EryC1/StrS family aminotransferase [Elusimicrobiota bacterium]
MNLAATVYCPPKARKAWRLEELFAPAALRHYAYGRQALAEALRLAGAEGKTVLLPSFICRETLAAVAVVNARPVYYDVSPELAPVLPPSRWPEAAAVMAVDYFGWPQDLTPFEIYSQRCGAALIEDAAHALFSRDPAGRHLGARAPLGVLSPRKSLPLPNGGALIASDPSLAARLPPQIEHRPVAGRRALLKAAARPIFSLAGAKASRLLLGAWRARSGRADADGERRLPTDAPCPQLGRPLVCVDPEAESSRRRALWTLCRAVAAQVDLAPVFEFLPENTVPYAYAFRTKNSEAAGRAFAAEGLGILPWPDLPRDIISQAPAYYRDVFLAHFLW